LAFRSVNLVVGVLQRDVQVERVVLLVVLERSTRRIPVIAPVVPSEWRLLSLLLGREDVFDSDSAVRSRERGMVVVERCGAFVVDDAPYVELGLTRLLALLQLLDAACDGFDGASDAFLVEKLGFGLMEVATTLLGNVEFDFDGTSWRVVHP